MLWLLLPCRIAVLESYLIARERFLKPGGLMMPTTGTLHVAPFSDAG